MRFQFLASPVARERTAQPISGVSTRDRLFAFENNERPERFRFQPFYKSSWLRRDWVLTCRDYHAKQAHYKQTVTKSYIAESGNSLPEAARSRETAGVRGLERGGPYDEPTPRSALRRVSA